ncbi:MAG TPA: peptide-methionine (S)-S-oxide reductase [Candidatus Udaeobacter sp.]|nr:peptide-methionine (S)-S-oxide reductase [Candidatus Udaeobacter sp.]
MWNVLGSSLVNRKSRTLFVISLLLSGLVFCPRAYGAPANIAYFAGGCFWCTEAIFEEAPGVTSVTSGYMHGAETIQVTFNPAKTSYEKLLILFWEAHDPTQINRQGGDIGKQYRSAIFYANDQQRDAAQKLKPQVQKFYSKPIATEITQAGSFRAAPENHQNFCRKNPNHPYVQEVVEPKLKKLGLKKP